MFNKKVTPEIKRRQGNMFQMLIDIFTPNAVVDSISSKNGDKKWLRTQNDQYTVTSMLDRHECTVKEGRRVLFEIYLDGDYLLFTRGMYLKHLKLDKELLKIVKSSLTYYEQYDMKHGLSLKEEQAKKVCEAYLICDDSYDNGLIRHGEIENSSKSPRLTR